MPFLFFTRPTELQEKLVVSTGQSQGYNYNHVGETARSPPLSSNVKKEGWYEIQRKVKVGYGKAAFSKTKRLLQQWEHFQLGWTFVNPKPPIRAGMGFCVSARAILFWTCNPLQIIYVNSTKKNGMHHYSFGSGTLKGHLIQGEERFSVEWSRKDDSVWYEVYSFSRPGNILSTVSAPFLRFLQHTFVNQSCDRMQKALKL